MSDERLREARLRWEEVRRQMERRGWRWCVREEVFKLGGGRLTLMDADDYLVGTAGWLEVGSAQQAKRLMMAWPPAKEP